MARKSRRQLHVSAGSFASREDACRYTEQQWETEPDEGASDEEYASWVERNPIWGLRNDLNTGLDGDFIETIDGDTRYEYLGGYLVNPTDLDLIRQKADLTNILVLIFPEGIHDKNADLSSTPKLVYCGAFDFRST